MGTPRVSIDSLTTPNSEPSNFEYTNSQYENTDSSSTKFEEWVNKQYNKAQNSISDEEKEEILSLYNKFPKSYYLNLSLSGIKFYFKSLFEALAFTHSKKIIHRDVKPSNFLYSVKKKHGVLVDFGLAERESEQEAIIYERNSSSTNSGLNPNIASRIYRRFDENGNPGVPRKDTRANRAGTRGFRAPEVLFKLPNQSTSIDIWSAGVILLCFLTKRFPFFQSTDDTEALLEISVLFGKVAMEQLSFELGRNFYTNIPTVKDKGIRFDALVRTYSMESWKADVDYSVKFDLAIDLLKKCLTLNSKNRITASEAIYHPFFE
ncbi:Cell cycle serine/threonine-protein kinase hsk1 [Smittium culicis]|uniref:non-specific serine/threonine protein kinase n=1 Tax=Smittium culicis TaxID=133412 RepID=A0A1R1YD83_9FUNG|nr:Cell cycle serine/threonine-protein kinase hsk1 [Smittium culicis]